MKSQPIVTALTLLVSSASTHAQFSAKPIDVTPADRAQAMRERPFIFGCGIIWNGRSTVYEMPEDFNRHLRERVEAAGVTATRFGFDWAAIEEEPGEYDWSIPEKTKGLDRLLEMDLEVIGLIATTPGWATATGEAGTFAPVDEAGDLFEAFCHELGKRYRGKIRRYQFGNNMDIDPGWQPKADAASYTRFLKRASRALKAADPDCLVATGGHIGRNPGFLDAIYRHGGGEAFDAVGVNPWPAYEAPQGDEAIDWQRIEDYRAVMIAHGDAAKPIWCTEFGWAFEKVGDQQSELARRAIDYLVHYDYVTVGIYVSMCDWHRGDGGLFGLCDKDLEPRPAYEVWQEVVKPLRQPGRPVPQPRQPPDMPSSRPTATRPAEPG